MHVISDREATDILRDLFNLSVPVAFETVKKMFRRKAKELHSDRSGGSDEGMKNLNVAFEKLSDLFTARSHIFDAIEGEDGAIGGPMLPTKTTDGTPLCDLGKGVGFRKNGIHCEYCDGKGYTLHHTFCFETVCPTCNGDRFVQSEFTCRCCGGTGKFTQAQSRRVVDCKRCGGSGKFKHPFHKSRCPRCDGSGYVLDDRHYRAIKCHKCDGCGEERVFNPVIPNGVIAG